MHANVCRMCKGLALIVAVCYATLCLCIDGTCGGCGNDACCHEIDSIVETPGEMVYKFGSYVCRNTPSYEGSYIVHVCRIKRGVILVKLTRITPW